MAVEAKTTSVLIVGGGPSGMALALLLDRFGIDCVVVEKRPGTTDHPRSRACQTRTMELFRQLGVEAAIRARGLPDSSDVIAFVESIAGREYCRTTPEPNEGLTPAWKCMVAQDVVEEELYEAVRASAHAKVLFSTEFVGAEEDAEGVVATCRDASNDGLRFRARYLIGADGAGSSVRRQAGIDMLGPATTSVMDNVYWRADLSFLPIVRETCAFIILPSDPSLPFGGILNSDGSGRWLTAGPVGAGASGENDDWNETAFVERARRYAGIPDLEVEVLHRSIWRVTRQIAANFRKGRTFLVGDAAHRFPPAGGYGLNSSVQDAHNLAWKLAHVLRGFASDRLLDTYSVERRPVADSNASFSVGNMVRMPFVTEAIRSGNPDAIAFRVRDADHHIHSVGQALGFSYEEGAVIPDGTAAMPLNSRIYTPSDRPGGRFPHQWLDLTRARSTLDWFDRDFVLVTGPLGGEWLEAGRSVASKLSVPLGLETLPHPYPEQGFEMGLRGAVLVRPDGHVAWRMPWLPADPSKALAGALTTLLH